MALLAVVALTLAMSGTWVVVVGERRVTTAREEAARAILLAEAAATHAEAVVGGPLSAVSIDDLLRGADLIVSTSDDGILVGHGLAATDAIADTGRVLVGGRYFVTLVDDPADGDGDPLTDSNGRVVARCIGTSDGGGSATLDVVIGSSASPAILVNGDLSISGTTRTDGACGGVHANEDLSVGGTLEVQATASASGSVSGSSNVTDLSGTTVGAPGSQPTIEVPDYSYASLCAAADFILRSDGFLEEVATGSLFDARSVPQNGWKHSSSSPVIWDLSGNWVFPGTYCVEGSAKMSGNPGEASATPVSLSVIATGSIEVSGNPQLEPSHPDGYLLVAMGDLSISGNPSGFPRNYQGILYGKSQCKVSGNPSIEGQLLCRDEPNPAGSVDYAALNEVSGDPTFTFDCGANANRRILHWYHRFGS